MTSFTSRTYQCESISARLAHLDPPAVMSSTISLPQVAHHDDTSFQPSSRLASLISAHRGTSVLAAPVLKESDGLDSLSPPTFVSEVDLSDPAPSPMPTYPPTSSAQALAELQVSSTSLPSSRSHLEGRSAAFKAVFVTATLMMQLLAQAQFGMVLIPLADLGRWLRTENVSEQSWMAASFGCAALPDKSVLGRH
jgi:hypothetical protein